MAVQKNKPTRSKRGMRRSHDKLKIPQLSIDQISGETHIRHSLTKEGFYRGKNIFNMKKKNKNQIK
ncbi:50S ribosomal subunit protein L32 [Wigglesworthia glossinidia endosymbiont of Glossina morsitans morsitans (Yale colony)]|uniref:Large ribosomal subunit protein bL32 n=1 Tax=Wigglesworthia glossinidia endosymbiont of Glossina morsitans morsitans (Yale colony) TaxID=1142511 RepID=H6Q5P9_WIGGL|nr:50S ribosomal protein L32 [Wigglesworthia glossinidia]AFA40954.1 50S ribosomal subunit protein L32 [Wigglesworthia glossinidia endosymbiont of Glossina morsitans morsitans (Yale colony)]